MATKKRNKKYTRRWANRPNWAERMSSLSPQMAMDCMKAPLAAAKEIVKGNATDDNLSYVSCVMRAMVILSKHYTESDEITKIARSGYEAFVRIYLDASEGKDYSLDDGAIVFAAVQTYADMVSLGRRGEVYDAFEQAQKIVFAHDYDWTKL